MSGPALLAAALALALSPQVQSSGPHQGGVSPGVAPVRFAVIGDYGTDSPEEADVAALVKGWQPDFVVTAGDNNYPDGAAATIDANIGKHYHAFIEPYLGAYGAGARTSRFFPALGNHDWNTPGAAPYLGWFDLPGNERYYELVRGPVHLFVLDSDPHEPDGIVPGSSQGQWLRSALAASSAPFKLVFLHHPPYSSGPHGMSFDLQWPYRSWGASAVIAGHDHDYERLASDGLPYFVNGAGGAPLYAFNVVLPESRRRFAADWGAMLVEAGARVARLRFATRAGTVIDDCTLPAGGPAATSDALVAKGATWKYLDTGVPPAADWTRLVFDDSAWLAGPAQLGYGDGDEATVTSFGPDPGDKHVTTWFRRIFAVPPPASYSGVELWLLRDDGAVVYLNGSEVARTNLPAGPIGPDTLALGDVVGGGERTFYLFPLPPSALQAGSNVLAVELHQSSPASSDTSFDLELRGLLVGTSLVASGATWKYLDTGVDPGPTWVQGGFDDSAWLSGPAQLGYGDGDEATVVSYGPDPGNKFTTTWFRHSFQSPAGSFAHLRLRLLFDDGAVVHLNGVEAARFHLPLASASSTLAGITVGGPDESTFLETSLDPALVVAGANVLALEIHQAAPTSSDISLDLELTGF